MERDRVRPDRPRPGPTGGGQASCPAPSPGPDGNVGVVHAALAASQVCPNGTGVAVPDGSERSDRDNGGTRNGEIDSDNNGGLKPSATAPGVSLRLTCKRDISPVDGESVFGAMLALADVRDRVG